MLVVEQERGQRARELGLAHSRRSQKDEAAERAIRILQTCACAPNRIRDRANGLVLPDDALMNALFHVDELLDFSLHQTADGDVRPLADDFGDVLLVDLLLEHRLPLLGRRRDALLFGAHHPLELGQTAVLQLGRLAIVASALRAFDLQAQLLQLFLELALALDGFLFLLPAGHQRRVLLLQIGELFLELLEALFRGLVFLFSQRLALDLELHHAAVDLIELGGHRVDFHSQLRRRLVDEIDRFVRQEAIGNVAVGEHRRRHDRRVLDANAVMNLVPLAEPAQDADGVFDGRLADHDRLEPPLEGRVLLDVLPVFVECGRADRMELASREHRLEHIRRVHRSFRGARPDDRVQLVDEENNLTLGLGHFIEDRLEAIFELAAVLRPGDERSHVERDDLLFLEPFGHVLLDDAPGKPFDDGRLADTGLADEHGIVLRAAREHLDDAANLFVASDDRIELAAACKLRQVAPVLLERLVFGFGILIGDALRPSHLRERLKNPILRDVVLLENLR